MIVRLSLLTLALCFSSCSCTDPPGGKKDDTDNPDPDDPDAGFVGCATDDDCPLGERCENELCVPATADISDDGCLDDADCEDGFLCATATGRCVLDAATPDVPTGPPGPCNLGEQRSCGVKVGACEYGVEECVDGQWSGVCLGAIGPTAETCNGLDDDCDTDEDEDFPGAGDACTDGTGACLVSGVQRCTDDGLALVCTAQGLDPTGRVELCGNGIDDDCNGGTDEGFESVGDACFVGEEPCRTQGLVICSADLRATTCDVPPPSGAEVCDGADNDGNGCVDEGFAIGVACSDGVGVCAASGLTICNLAGDGVMCGATVGTPAAQETCDGDDDDCNGVNDNGCDDDDDNYCDGTLAWGGNNLTCPLTTSAGTRDCNDTDAAVSPADAEICYNGVDEDCSGALDNGCAPCNPTVDADFDGSYQCDDCDETNGAIFPGATERCNGVSDDCDAQIDETFDGDGDTYTTCGTVPGGGLDPARIDCNDNNATINPGACELCLSGGTPVCGTLTNDAGNNVDEDCDGFVDELCSPCSNADTDKDSFSECEGDCDNADNTVFPGRPEICDGKDNDCNRNTVDNCDVGDPCNFPVDTDECMDRLICVESLTAGGNGTGNYTCTSFCNLTAPGLGLGDSCDLDETCGSALTPTGNLHGCSVTTGIGALATGQDCDNDDECRSASCLRDGRLVGPPDKYCTDLCTRDDSCPSGFTCQASSAAPSYGRCMRTLTQQGLSPGEACTNTTAPQCENGSASCATIGGQQRCREPCCENADCGANEYCSLLGVQAPGPNGGVDTLPVCAPESGGNGGRLAGAACGTSTQCASEFCDINLGVCVDTCCNDTTCPTGLLCESAVVTLSNGSQTFARMCLNTTPTEALEAE